ncbi:hypothetical protein ATCC90586_010583 [Pythium insidiosum]|nr:hypothetical protein ATCC90586_010583 [Pythium insidiosum]
MVLVRRRDKRRGNAEHEIVVASDSSIVANKGVRSLQSARSGRFAADMRANVGGYGRPDKTWGVDHPWHQTREDLFKDLSARDRMEDGVFMKQDDPAEKCRGLSRAALKKKKAKMKKGGVSASSVASSDIGSEHVPTSVTNEDNEEHVQEPVQDEAPVKEQETEKTDDKAAPGEQSEERADEENAGKKRKRTNRNKKKKEKLARLADDAGDISDDDAAENLAPADDKKAKKAKTDATLAPTTQDTEKRKANEIKAREALARQYELACGQEFTTASGLVMRDVRIGQGRLPEMGEMLTVRYKGRLGDQNGLVFGKGMLSTNFGTGSVIAGWEEGMGTMRPGGIRHLTIPAELGYGASGKGGKIPPNSVLFFEVELVRIGKRKRDTIGKDDIPLPSAFQRKKIKAGPSQSGNSKSSGGDAKGNGKGKRRRRKHSI